MKKFVVLFILSIYINTHSSMHAIDRNRLCSAMARIHCTYTNDKGDKTTQIFCSSDGAGFACIPRKNGKGCEPLSKDSPKVKKFCKEKMPTGYTKISSIKVSVAGM